MEGNGLGLALVKRILELSDGVIRVESEGAHQSKRKDPGIGGRGRCGRTVAGRRDVPDHGVWQNDFGCGDRPSWNLYPADADSADQGAARLD